MYFKVTRANASIAASKAFISALITFFGVLSEPEMALYTVWKMVQISIF